MFYTEGIGKLFYVVHPYFSLLIKLTAAQLFQHQNVLFSHVFFGPSSSTAFLYPLCVFTQRCAQKTTHGFLFCFNCLHQGTRLICHIYYNKWDQFHSLTNRKKNNNLCLGTLPTIERAQQTLQIVLMRAEHSSLRQQQSHQCIDSVFQPR